MHPIVLAFFAAFAALSDDPAPAAPAGQRWPAFRGGAGGETLARDLPREWSAEANVAWSIELEGYGQSSPVLWDGLVFVTSVAGPSKERCLVACYRASDGALLWLRTFDASLAIEATGMVSRGAPTPAVDAERVYAFFESGDLVALSHAGDTLWRRSLTREHGPFGGNHGVASSVVLAGDALVLLLDHDGPSYLVALDAASGASRWRVEREPRVSWSTPALAGDELVVSSNGVVEGFDLRDGRRRWAVDGVRGNTVPSPTVVGRLVVVGSSEVEGNLVIERPEPGGDGQARVLWRASGARPSGFGSPLVHAGRILLVSKTGALSCLRLLSGELLWSHRLSEPCWASPIAAGELVYLFGSSGTTTLLCPTDEGPGVVAENRLPLEPDARVYAAAAVDGALFLRSGRRLTRVGAGP